MVSASKHINNMPIGERDCEDGGNVEAPSTFDMTIRSREAYLLKTARRRQELRTIAEKAFRAVNNRSMLNWERDRMLDTVNRQIVSEFGATPKVRM